MFDEEGVELWKWRLDQVKSQSIKSLKWKEEMSVQRLSRRRELKFCAAKMSLKRNLAEDAERTLVLSFQKENLTEGCLLG